MIKSKRPIPNIFHFVIDLIMFLAINCLVAGAANADQEELLKIEGAKKEGIISLYTTLDYHDAGMLLAGFRQKYPFIKTEVYRSGSERLLTKILTESRAKKYVPDVFFSDSDDSHIIINEGLAKKYVSPESKVYSKEFKAPDSSWTSAFVITRVLAYNTNIVKPKDVPKKYEDLLDHKWNGQLGMPADEIGWFAAQLQIMGRDDGIAFMKRLCNQNIQFRRGKLLSTQLLAAGEFPILVVTSGHIVEALKSKGAAVEWVGIEPVVTVLMPALVTSHAPHPNAGMLFVDFVLSREGQEILKSVNRIPLRPDVPPNPPRLIKGLKLLTSNPSWSGKEYTRLYREIFSKRTVK